MDAVTIGHQRGLFTNELKHWRILARLSEIIDIDRKEIYVTLRNLVSSCGADPDQAIDYDETGSIRGACSNAKSHKTIFECLSSFSNRCHSKATGE